MKIALLTIWHERNYGAELQAYATIKVLQKMGHEVKMIDIRLSDYPRLNWRGRIADMITKMGPGYHKFCDFWNKNIPTTKRYKTIGAIKNDPPEADIYMVGSDQVWNPELTGKLFALYFLDFGRDDVRRISYASSFGTNKWAFADLNSEIRGLLKKFDNIACREDSGVRILKDEFGVDADMVLDPTLLLEDYKELTGEVKERKTLVFYPLLPDPELERYSRNISMELGLDFVNNNSIKMIGGKIEWDRLSVAEWVKNIAEAKFVITRSFHGMVFSILYKKQFAVLVGKNGLGTRLESLLKLLNLEERIFYSKEAMSEAKPWMSMIDYDKVTPLLKKYREKSIMVLKHSIEREI